MAGKYTRYTTFKPLIYKALFIIRLLWRGWGDGQQGIKMTSWGEIEKEGNNKKGKISLNEEEKLIYKEGGETVNLHCIYLWTMSRYWAWPVMLVLSLSMIVLTLTLPAQYSTQILLFILFWAGETTPPDPSVEGGGANIRGNMVHALHALPWSAPVWAKSRKIVNERRAEFSHSLSHLSRASELFFTPFF